MNSLLLWLTSPEWAQVVKALLHSLWQGALIAGGLALLLQRIASPKVRYRFALGGLGAVVAAAIVTWGALSAPGISSPAIIPTTQLPPAPPSAAEGATEKIVVAARWSPAKPEVQWTAWLALVWLIGASAMLGRASVKVAGAEQLRRTAQPLNDPRIAGLVAEARRAVKLTRRVRAAVTDQLTSPAVVGLLVPTLILPLTLITTLSPEQIRFVLLHELAHIRRGDYLANLFQLFAEALFFFNPAVWWISHEIRREREACCDALAIELSGAPTDYARTLVSVAETVLSPAPAAAPAFGNERESSSLSDRVQRLLVPGYRPSLRLTWRAMMAALVLGGLLLGLSATGTRATVAAILPSQQNDAQIERPADNSNETPPTSTPTREVVFRFKHPAGVVPKGTVSVTIPGANILNLNASTVEMRSIQNGEVRVEVPIGGRTFIQPKQTVGCLFADEFMGHVVTNGTGPMVIEIPTRPAGVVYARARNADGSFADNLRFSVVESSKSSSHDRNLSQYGDVNASGKESVSLPLPLGGSYRIIGRRGNSFCASDPITLTKEKPTAEVELQFNPCRSIECRALDPFGRPVRNVAVAGAFRIEHRGFGLKLPWTDDEGRFRIADVTPGVGDYKVLINAPGLGAESVRLDFASDVNIIHLKPGLKITGQVVEEGTGYVIPGVELRAICSITNGYPFAVTHTDDEGRFEFNTLADTSYCIYVNGAACRDQDVKAGRAEPVTLRVKPYSWSNLKPVAPKSASASRLSRPSDIATARKASATPVSSQTTETGAGRKQIISKLEGIRLERVFFDRMPLGQVVRFLTEESRRSDPDRRGINFMINPAAARGSTRLAEPGATIDPATGLPMGPAVASSESLVSLPITISPALTGLNMREVLDAVVKAAPRPIRYSVKEHAVAFGLVDTKAPLLHTRTFKVDPNVIAQALATVGPVERTNILAALRQFLTQAGVHLEPPETVFYNDRAGMIWVRASLEDLDTIQSLVEAMNAQPPQVNIRARFVEVPAAEMDFLQDFLPKPIGNFPTRSSRPTAERPYGPSFFHTGATAQLESFTGILTEPQAKQMLKTLEETMGVDVLSAPEVTTLSGRQAQVQVVDGRTIVSGVSSVVADSSATNIYQTTNLMFGPILDVIPRVGPDGYTVTMNLTSTVNEFLGYEKPDRTLARAVRDKTPHATLPLPHYRRRQATTSATVWDGQTIVIGGFISESVTRNPDGTERRKSTPKLDKKQLLVFVTPTIIDPAGNRVHSAEALPFDPDKIPPQAPPKNGD